MTKYSTNPQGSNRVQERDALLKEALAQPRVRDIMRVYQNYQKQIRGLIHTVWRPNVQKNRQQPTALTCNA